MSAGGTLLHILSYAVGTVALLVWSIIAIWNGYLNPKRARLVEDVAQAQYDLWSLERDDPGAAGLEHRFLSICEGIQLHYISSPTRTASRKLIIFLHGFPDSCHIFAPFLSSPLANHANIVSLDLPGFGGSDGLPNYDANHVLNAITEAILMLKERHLGSEPDQCILVGHDWGAVITSRLAMETAGLIDRVVIINGPIPKLFLENLRTGIETWGKHLRAWQRTSFKMQALYDAREAIQPVLTQLVQSNYIFMFNLPFCRMRYFRFVVEYLVSACHRAAAGESAEAWAAWSWASSIGPSVNECAPSSQGLSYGKDVRERSISAPRGDWDTRIRLYKEGLFAGNWTLKTGRNNCGVKQVEEGQKACLQCPVSIVWGLRDPALNYRVCLKGAERFFRSGGSKRGAESNIILTDDCGHWSPLEETCANVLRDLLLEFMDVTAAGFSIISDRTEIRRSDFR